MTARPLLAFAVYAQNAIRIKGTGLSYLRLSSRLDAVASRVQSAVKMQAVTQQMGQVTKGMDKVLSSMDVDKITGAQTTSNPQALHLASHCRWASTWWPGVRSRAVQLSWINSRRRWTTSRYEHR